MRTSSWLAAILPLGCVGIGLAASSPAPPAKAPPSPPPAAATTAPPLAPVEAPDDPSSGAIEKLRADAIAHPADMAKQGIYGLALVRAGRSEEGLDLLEKTNADHPNEPELMMRYAKALWKTSRPAEALEMATRAANSPLASDSVAGEALFTAGAIKARTGEADEAEKLLRRAVERDSKNAGAFQSLALLMIRRDRPTEALMLLEKALAAQPHHQKLNYYAAQIFEGAGHPDRAFELWKNLAELRPDDPAALVEFARRCLDRSRFAQAEPLLEHAVQVNPAHAAAHFYLAQVLMNLGKYDRASIQAGLAQRLGRSGADMVAKEIADRRDQKLPIPTDRSKEPLSETPATGDLPVIEDKAE